MELPTVPRHSTDPSPRLQRFHIPQISQSTPHAARAKGKPQALCEITYHAEAPQGSHWFLGQFPTLLKQTSGDPHREWIREIPNDGLIRYRHIGNVERVLLTSPKALAEVLVTRNYEFQKPPQLAQGLGQLLGIGVLLSEGDEHKRQRKALMPAFSYRHIKNLVPLFWSKAREVTEKMTNQLQTDGAEGNGSVEKRTNSGVLEVATWASRVTLDIIGLAGMGRDFGAVENPSTELNDCYRRVFQPDSASRRVGQLLSLFVPFWIVSRLPLKRNKEVQEARALIRRVCHELIEGKRARLTEGKPTDVDILSVALSSGSFTDENLVDQVMTFLAAGHETTSSAMQWAVYLLCLNPMVQSKLRADIRAKLPSISDTQANVTAEDVDKVAFLHAVCHETLRFIPSVPLTMRIAAHDTTLLGHHIKKGTTIILAPWAVNHSSELWGPDAGEFKPERWLHADGTFNGSGGADSNYSFLTFLHGPRSCIGQRFALEEFAVLLAAWAGRFSMEFPDPDFKLDIAGGVTVKPKGGLKVKATVVEGW